MVRCSCHAASGRSTALITADRKSLAQPLEERLLTPQDGIRGGAARRRLAVGVAAARLVGDDRPADRREADPGAYIRVERRSQARARPGPSRGLATFPKRTSDRVVTRSARRGTPWRSRGSGAGLSSRASPPGRPPSDHLAARPPQPASLV